MKPMIISVRNIKKMVTGKVLAITLAGMLALPAGAYSQDRDADPGEEPSVESPSSTSSGPWQNSAGSTIGTRDNGSSAATAARPAAPDPRLGPGGGSISSGATPDGRGPGGNPDVPFDENMNLAFLAAGILFAFLVVRKRLKLQAVPVKK